MKLINNSEYILTHGLPIEGEKFYKLEIGNVLEVPKDVAELWLRIDGVKEYAEPKDVKAAEEKAKAEKEALNAKIAKLEAELTKIKEPKKTTVKPKAKTIKKK